MKKQIYAGTSMINQFKLMAAKFYKVYKEWRTEHEKQEKENEII